MPSFTLLVPVLPAITLACLLAAESAIAHSESINPNNDNAKPYRSGPLSGAVQIGDAIVALQQVGANCTVGPP